MEIERNRYLKKLLERKENGIKTDDALDVLVDIVASAKYYFEDIGLRNARLNFRQQEENHIMENIIYTELRSRGYRIDVGVVEAFETNTSEKREQGIYSCTWFLI